MSEGARRSQGWALTRYGTCKESIVLLHIVQAVWPAVHLLDDKTLLGVRRANPVESLPFSQESWRSITLRAWREKALMQSMQGWA